MSIHFTRSAAIAVAGAFLLAGATAQAQAPAPAAPPAGVAPVIERLLAATPGVAATTDGRFFARQRGLPILAAEVLDSRAATDAGTICREINARLKPGSRIRPAAMLRALRENDRFVAHPGRLYTLRDKPHATSPDQRQPSP